MEKKEISLVTTTQKRILQYLSENDYHVDSTLPKERDFAEILGVSRVVVREALSCLRTLGLLETKRKKGTVLVAPRIFNTMNKVVQSGLLDDATVKNLYELRLMLEIGMADYLFNKRTDEYVKKLHELVVIEEDTHDQELLRSLDIKFHSLLYELSGNKSLMDFQFLLSNLFLLYPPRETNWKQSTIITHRSLLEIIKTGNPDSFRTAMRLHLNTQFINQEKNLGSLPNKRR